MTRTQTSQHRARATVGFARGLAAMALLVAIIFGIPAILLAFGGFPAPDHVPTWEEIADLLLRPDDGSLFIGALTWIAWVAWLVLTALTAVEVFTQLRGMPPLQLPGVGWLQIALAGLVSTAVVGLSGEAASADEPPEVAVVAYQASEDEQANQDTGQESAENADTEDADSPKPVDNQRLYTVQPGESYWSIAENELGDPERYPEIVAANEGRTMPNGTTLSGDEFLAPGWELVLPAGPDEQQESSDATVHTVKSGETLSSIASDYLGTPEASSEIFEANQGAAQPGGARLSDPDAIDVGWTLSIPETSANTSSEPPGSAQDSDADASQEETAPEEPSTDEGSRSGENAPRDTDDDGSEDGETSDQAENGTPSPSHESPNEQSPEEQDVGIATPTEDPDETVDLDLASEDDSDQESPPVAAIVGYSGLAAVGLLGVLGMRRRNQMRNRRPGHRIVQDLSEDAQAVEEEVHNASTSASVELLDRGLRSLAAKCASTQTTLPTLVGARVSETQCEIFVGEDAPEIAVSPFRTESPGTWRLNPDSSALLTQNKADELRAPYPGLATLGHARDSAQILVDLPQAGAIGLYGPDEDTTQVLTALALELATSAGTDHVNLSCIGFAGELATTTKTGRIRSAGSVHECLRELELLTLEYASGESPTEDIPPEVVLSAYPLTREHLGRMRTIVGHAAAPPIAIIAAATDEHPLPGNWHLDTTASQELPVLGQQVTLKKLSDDEYTKLADLLHNAEDLRSVAAPGWEGVPSEDELELASSGPKTPEQRAGTSPAPDEGTSEPISPGESTPPSPPTTASVPQDAPPSLDTYEVQLRVLGPVELNGPDPAHLETGKRKVLTELACLLRLHTSRSPDQISRSMGGPRGPWTAKYRSDNLSKLRVWLGRARSGKLHFPTMNKGAYALSPTVGCDWDCFQQLVQLGLASTDAAGTALLEEALALVRGEPFSGTPLDRYAWAEPLKPTMLAAIVDTAHTIAARHLSHDYGNLDSAREALLKVLEIDPVCELLVRDLVRVEHAASNPEGITRAVQRLYVALNNLDLEMSEETEQLLKRYGVR